MASGSIRAGPRWAQGFGLLGMQERAALVGATLADRIGSRAEGTTISCGWRAAGPPHRRPTMPESQHPLRILLADDHVTVRHGLKLLIDSQPDMKVVAEASDGDTAVQRALELKPDVIVMDISMPGMNGLVATREAETAAAGRRDRHADAAWRRCLSAGAAAGGRVRLRVEAERADRAAAGHPRGGGRRAVPRFHPHVARHRRVPGARRASGRARRAATISERESEVLRLIASGYSNKEIAAQLDLSVKTVEAHKANAMRKLDLNGRIDIVEYAVLQGWLHNT